MQLYAGTIPVFKLGSAGLTSEQEKFYWHGSLKRSVLEAIVCTLPGNPEGVCVEMQCSAVTSGCVQSCPVSFNILLI